jgi:isoquinoline 1-oxidoreductase subunit beta
VGLYSAYRVEKLPGFGKPRPIHAPAERNQEFESVLIPHIAHATMEPPSATVRVADGKCEAWACVQSPGNTREELAKKLGLKEEDVTVHVTLLGGGFGRKSKCDFVSRRPCCRKQ